MSRGGNYSGGKREREAERARQKQEKAQRKAQRREAGSSGFEVVSAEEATRGIPSTEDALRDMERKATEGRSAASIPVRLFVGSLGDEIGGEDLRAAFEPFGPIVEAVVVLDRDTRRSRGFGFVTMANRKDAPRAIDALDGSELKGRRIAVNVATDRSR